MLSWSDNGIIIDDIKEYIYNVYKTIKNNKGKSFVINQKSSGNKTYACLRISLPKHTTRYERINDTDEESKEILNILDQVINETQYNNKNDKEEIVKDKNGVEWIRRKKERGEGYTYCKKDDRSVTMSQNEYNKYNAIKSKNESQYSKLKYYLIESVQ